MIDTTCKHENVLDNLEDRCADCGQWLDDIHTCRNCGSDDLTFNSSDLYSCNNCGNEED